jgi:hypothetical protein
MLAGAQAIKPSIQVNWQWARFHCPVIAGPARPGGPSAEARRTREAISGAGFACGPGMSGPQQQADLLPARCPHRLGSARRASLTPKIKRAGYP